MPDTAPDADLAALTALRDAFGTAWDILMRHRVSHGQISELGRTLALLIQTGVKVGRDIERLCQRLAPPSGGETAGAPLGEPPHQGSSVVPPLFPHLGVAPPGTPPPGTPNGTTPNGTRIPPARPPGGEPVWPVPPAWFTFRCARSHYWRGWLRDTGAVVITATTVARAGMRCPFCDSGAVIWCHGLDQPPDGPPQDTDAWRPAPRLAPRPPGHGGYHDR